MKAKNWSSLFGAASHKVRGSPLIKIGLALLIMAALMSSAEAGCSGCGVWYPPDDWGLTYAPETSATAAAETTAESTPAAETATTTNNPDESSSQPTVTPQSISPEELLADLEGDSKYTMVYVSNKEDSEYIKGSVLLPSTSFLDEDGNFLSATELAKVFGDAGISQDDSLVVYSDCLSCGDSTLAYWILSYLGHKDVKLLEGNVNDWNEAGLPIQSTSAVRDATTYVPEPNLQLLASYMDVILEDYQIVDARSADDFAAGNIPGSVNIVYDDLIDGSEFKDETALASYLSALNKESTVIVYSARGGHASIVWYILQLLGYDARLYTWQDWVAQQA